MSPVAGVTSVPKHAFLSDDVPWRSTSGGMNSVPRIHNSPVLRVHQNPASDYAIQVMKHPNPIREGFAMEAQLEAAGPECIVPGQMAPVRLLGLKVWPIDVNLKFMEPVNQQLMSVGKFMDSAFNLMNAPTIEERGRRPYHNCSTWHPRQQVGCDCKASRRQNRQRHKKPLEFHPQAPLLHGSSDSVIPMDSRFSMPNNPTPLPSDNIYICEPNIKREEIGSENGSSSENDKEPVHAIDSTPQPELHQDPPYLYRPVARVSAFRPYNHHYAPAIKPIGMGCTISEDGSVEQKVPAG